MKNIKKLRHFVTTMTQIIEESGHDEKQILKKGTFAMRQLIKKDDWLPERYSKPDQDHYQQYLLYCDPNERISVVSFVWGPGQESPIHNHKVWGIIGMLRGTESCKNFELSKDGKTLNLTSKCCLKPKDISIISPKMNDIHKVENISKFESVSIHVYGANIGSCSRNIFDPKNGRQTAFISGYSNSEIPNIWDRS